MTEEKYPTRVIGGVTLVFPHGDVCKGHLTMKDLVAEYERETEYESHPDADEVLYDRYLDAGYEQDMAG